ncbi:hypothetical protein OUZ56_013309 [Daphnia magna]|uniref:Uncharacterized protein n=1 Tax=Daphnia magna TaxID=35525 RepID=A0ABQ9Z5I7_9CRUS|nr:hypothetical protein OUZ56_013309 [Daphnia magna]
MNGDNQRRGQPMAMRNQIQDHALIPGVPGKQGKQGECRSIWKERILRLPRPPKLQHIYGQTYIQSDKGLSQSCWMVVGFHWPMAHQSVSHMNSGSDSLASIRKQPFPPPQNANSRH